MRRVSTQLRRGDAVDVGIDSLRSRSAIRPGRESSETEVVQMKQHRRAMSDPFDAADDDAPDSNEPPLQSSTGGLPTLRRFPVESSKNRNCWSQAPIDIFKVRGPRYLSGVKQKVTSSPYLFEARGVDLYLKDKGVPDNIGRYSEIFGGKLRAAPTFIINFRFPWGALVLYFSIPDKFLPFLRAKYCEGSPTPSMAEMTSPAEKAMCRFLMGDTNYKNSTLKLIPYVAEGPWVVRNLVTGKPAIIGKRLPITYTYQPADPEKHLCEYLEADLDIGSSSAAAKKIVSVCRRYMGALTVDIGFVIEGSTPEELPEQMMGCARIHRIDPLKAPKLP
mmetsp:Transcript_11911/g.21646  ORF Transcript_11911/g.21646 Transcript_11911/m.21646 type:complete len:333 (-) Transcript_11911:288-1286(-)|eukprot:CAMPEP_0198280158 /NCGR_PEP_ID=MMETSP1449-20131203/300_1 /TAXON_ID=420275 /ORGANISM="Attheya septentrionalis, Strain CCMP2084" /LENGTH=332 /DNA_ID=CAMNT_0043975441 /DNA_START=122 /DNA_END=1120 /DNA_ORIENTATION=+